MGWSEDPAFIEMRREMATRVRPVEVTKDGIEDFEPNMFYVNLHDPENRTTFALKMNHFELKNLQQELSEFLAQHPDPEEIP